MARKLTRVALAISSAAMVLSLTASLAMAGEVKGPPNQIDNTNVTGAVWARRIPPAPPAA